MADNKATSKAQEFKALSKKDQQRKIGDLILNNAMYIIIAIAIIFITVKQPKFISLSSIVNIISLTAAKLPIALGIGGCIVLTGTDISAGRVVGLAACISASLLTTVFKVFPNMTSAMPIPVVLLIVLGVGAAVGFVNGFSVAKFKLHPFIVTLSTQLITYGIILMYLMNGGMEPDRRQKDGKKKRGGEKKDKRARKDQGELMEAARFFKENVREPEHLLDGRRFLTFGDNVYLVPEETPELTKIRVLRPGLQAGTLKKGRMEPAHALARFHTAFF